MTTVYFMPGAGDHDGDPNNPNNWFIDSGAVNGYGMVPQAGDNLVVLENTSTNFTGASTYGDLDTSAVSDTINTCNWASAIFAGSLTLGHAGWAHSFSGQWTGSSATLRGTPDLSGYNVANTFGSSGAAIAYDCSGITLAGNFLFPGGCRLSLAAGANFTQAVNLQFGTIGGDPACTITVGAGATLALGVSVTVLCLGLSLKPTAATASISLGTGLAISGANAISLDLSALGGSGGTRRAVQ